MTLIAVEAENRTVKGPFHRGVNWNPGVPSFQVLMYICDPGRYKDGEVVCPAPGVLLYPKSCIACWNLAR